ncbi:hypothetical protein OU994_01670 [Pseudoduganella sp. SL102]|uniref:hypothetical protein n=1 Tax=Pseudoduganella sp. SL102 TaxID=2995154 RepID=UPI00248CECDF|nr:hypothetical protein [Pseudoduganella sp. SL102]WBS03043.1 hypothetical protein OU994_01670 [Pseudoduganella sp. SL102]
MLLLIYPFQVALAMADRCCLTTPQGVTHHASAAQPGAQPVALAADDHGSASDPHCAACVFVHTISVPPTIAMLPAVYDTVPASSSASHWLASHSPGRPERPQWQPAADQ